MGRIAVTAIRSAARLLAATRGLSAAGPCCGWPWYRMRPDRCQALRRWPGMGRKADEWDLEPLLQGFHPANEVLGNEADEESCSKGALADAFDAAENGKGQHTGDDHEARIHGDLAVTECVPFLGPNARLRVVEMAMARPSPAMTMTRLVTATETPKATRTIPRVQ